MLSLECFRIHRNDVVSMGRITGSPHIIGIYYHHSPSAQDSEEVVKRDSPRAIFIIPNSSTSSSHISARASSSGPGLMRSISRIEKKPPSLQRTNHLPYAASHSSLVLAPQSTLPAGAGMKWSSMHGYAGRPLSLAYIHSRQYSDISVLRFTLTRIQSSQL